MSEVSIWAPDLTGNLAETNIGPEVTSFKENGRALREASIFGVQGNQTEHALYNGVPDPAGKKSQINAMTTRLNPNRTIITDGDLGNQRA